MLIVQDLFLQIPLGTIARSPYIFLSPLVFLFITVISKKLYLQNEIKYYLIYYGYSIIIATFLIFYYVFILNHDINIYGENLVIKFMKSSMYNLIILLTFYNFIFIFKNSSFAKLEKILKYLVLTQIFIGCVQLAIPNAFNFLKTSELSITERLSLLNTEPSHSFPQLLISILSFLVIRYYNNAKLKTSDYFISIAGFILLIFIQSKGGLLNLVICFLLLILFTRQSLKRRIQLFSFSLLFMIPTIWIIVTILIPEFISDMDTDFGGFVSFSTRSVTILTALKGLIQYPLGQGYSTYLITFPTLLNDTYNSALSWSPIPLSGFEIDWMLTTGRALTVKSGLLNETLYSGWAIILFYVFLFREAFIHLRSIRHKQTLFLIAKFIILFIIVNYLFVSSIETSYIAFLPFALLVKLHSANQTDWKNLVIA